MEEPTPLVSVITGATGHPRLARCMESLQSQTYAKVEHWLVVDGTDRLEKVRAATSAAPRTTHTRHTIVLPRATGSDRFNGHRIYGAFSFLADGRYIAFLDEDNWFDEDHIESLVAAVSPTAAPWAFSLRRIVDQEGCFIAADRCESLGNLHPAYYDDREHLVDTSCYLIRRDLAVQLSPIWNRPARPPRGTSSADRALCRALMAEHPRGVCTRRHSVNYSVGNRPDSVNGQFFLRGNEVMRKRYPDGLPWEIDGEGARGHD